MNACFIRKCGDTMGSCCKISLQVDENKGNKKFLGEVTTTEYFT